MGVAVNYFTIGKTIDSTGYVLPLVANPAPWRELINAIPKIMKKMPAPRRQEAWDALAKGKGMVYLDPELQWDLESRGKMLAKERLEALSAYTAGQKGAGRTLQEVEAKLQALVDEAHLALQAAVLKHYGPVVADMKFHHYPLPANVSSSSFRKAEQKMVDRAFPAGWKLMPGAQQANVNLNSRQNPPLQDKWTPICNGVMKEEKGKRRDWFSTVIQWGWMIDAVIFASMAGVLAATAAMGPLGWALMGAVALTTLFDKWQGGESKTALVANRLKRLWHGFYEKENSVRRLNYKSWKFWLAGGLLVALGLNLGFLAPKLFLAAAKVAHQVFAALYAMAGVSYTGFSILTAIDKFLDKKVGSGLWWHTVKDRPEKELSTLTTLVGQQQAEVEAFGLAEKYNAATCDDAADQDLMVVGKPMLTAQALAMSTGDSARGANQRTTPSATTTSSSTSTLRASA